MAYLHIITRKLLTGFQDERKEVWQLSKGSGTTIKDSPKNLGGEHDPWPKEIEEGAMGKMDSVAHRLLTHIIRSDGECDLAPDQRLALLRWMFYYLVRSTTNRQACMDMVAEGERSGNTKAEMLAELVANAAEVYRKGSPGQPEWVGELIDQVGQEEFTAFMVQQQALRIVNDQMLRITGDGLYHQMLKANRMAEFIPAVQDMRWTWLRSETDLVIGDNPFCRSQAGGIRFGYALNRPDLEVTFPLSKRLCLLMHRHPGLPPVKNVRRMVAIELNRRQIESALALAWGRTQGSLRPKPN